MVLLPHMNINWKIVTGTIIGIIAGYALLLLLAVPQDIPLFIKAERGDVEAQKALGEIRLQRDGDKEASAKWFLKAADQGDDMAQTEMGEVYEHGWGVKQDYQEALFWYSLGVWNTPKNSKPDYAPIRSKERDAVAAHLSPQQKAEVEKRLQEWLKDRPAPASK